MTDSQPTTPRDGAAMADACATCVLGRREFVRQAAFAALTVGASGSQLAALPVGFVDATAAQGAALTYPIPDGDSVNIDRKNDTILARAGNRVYVFARACPHQNTALRWNNGDHQFQCPKHGSKYTATGVFVEGRATRSMDRFAVRKEGSTIVVDLDVLYQQDTDAAQWDAAWIVG